MVKLFQCLACLTVSKRETPSCLACDTPNSVHPAPKGARMPRRRVVHTSSRGPLAGPEGFDGELGLDDDSSSDEPPNLEPTEEAIPIGDVEVEFPERVSMGLKGFNRVLGCNRGTKGPYGAARGTSIMISGPPGIGKSTLLIQTVKRLTAQGKVVYATGEQSASDVRLYAESFGGLSKREKKRLLVLKSNSTDDLIAAVLKHKPLVLIVDSIQVFSSSNVNGKAASEPQSKYLHEHLCVDACKPLGTICFLVSQVTKDGDFRGPNTIAHLADVDLSFEPEDEDNPQNKRRILIAKVKNRFGEAGVPARFKMTDKGLVGLKIPRPEPSTRRRARRSRAS